MKKNRPETEKKRLGEGAERERERKKEGVEAKLKKRSLKKNRIRRR